MADRHRFELVYTTHFDDVLRYCLRRSNREDALDATAETFTVAWRRRDDMPMDRPLPWLYGVARRVLANQWRSTERRRNTMAHLRVVETDRYEETEPQVVRDQQSRDLIEAMGRLRSADQEIIRLAGWEELGREEIGVALGCTPNAVTKRFNRALDRLGNEMGVVRSRRGRFFRRKGALG